ncbi:MAG TPA: helix-turn-helix transcriptional regulator [Candidatus Gallacutalibacter stercoravium]|nr:helix-turn-helix transcriptional regulator [Candidatus Gallacutalibacter stercoravium]
MVFDFGYRLKELRQKKGLTQAQVAKRLSLSKTAISGYENNIKNPSIEVLTQLSILYGVSAEYLLGLENRKMLCVDDLNDQQLEVVRILLEEFRHRTNY